MNSHPPSLKAMGIMKIDVVVYPFTHAKNVYTGPIRLLLIDGSGIFRFIIRYLRISSYYSALVKTSLSLDLSDILSNS